MSSSWKALFGYGSVSGAEGGSGGISSLEVQRRRQLQQRQRERPHVERDASDGGDAQDDDVASMDIDDAIERLGMGWFQFEILVAAGLCFAADAMEVLLLSFLTVVLEHEWGLTSTQASSVVSVVFVGAMAGTMILGPLGDRIGRKPVFRITAGMLSVFGVGTALIPDAEHGGYEWLVVARFFVGFGVGGLTVPFDTLAEFVPTSHRGQNLLYIEFFWTAGTLLVPAVAWITLDTSDGGGTAWRSFVAWCAVPCMVSTILGMMYVPESPRWLVTQSRNEEAVRVLRHAARRNGHDDPYALFPDGMKLTTPEMIAAKSDPTGIVIAHEEASLADLFSNKWRIITLLLWGTWTGLAFLYYGVILLVSIVFSDGGESASSSASDSYDFDYSAIFISASSEVFGLFIAIGLIDRLGRIKLQSLSYLLGGAFSCILAWSTVGVSRPFVIATAFAARMFMMCASCTTWVSTSEMLSTEIRSTGHSAANAMARIGGAVCPFIINANHMPLRTIGVIMLVSSILTSSLSCNLPETAGKAMGESTDASNDDMANQEPNDAGPVIPPTDPSSTAPSSPYRII